MVGVKNHTKTSKMTKETENYLEKLKYGDYQYDINEIIQDKLDHYDFEKLSKLVTLLNNDVPCKTPEELRELAEKTMLYAYNEEFDPKELADENFARMTYTYVTNSHSIIIGMFAAGFELLIFSEAYLQFYPWLHIQHEF